ncbi:HAD-IIIC family phosphatase [Sphingomonas azotifigens]|uniref:HAD-IIIC family phosphatase n=1 Tax=Sphingomonas azotifigens TaxID=330920 RepID=UPI000A07895D|nr:HAD-IIIC family phosphatase [Sphingomonas azotifigens]
MWTAPIKLILWDLDDTLWRGTLADGDPVELYETRAELVRAFNARGVVSSICSKNDFEVGRAQLEAFGLWDEFVFPHIAFTPKAQAVAEIIADMQLRPVNVLFIDDNPHNLGEVRHALPDIQTLDATAPDADAQLAGLLALQTGTRSRVAEYRILEAKKRDRAAAPGESNEAFLRASGLCACAPALMDNLDFAPRIAELINRSNQLNYTRSRVELDALKAEIINVNRHDSVSIFAWDKYGRYGLVGFAMFDIIDKRLVHFTFSCRAMHLGLEQYALDKLAARQVIAGADPHVRIDASAWEGRFSTATADWIQDCDFNDPKIRAELLAEHLEQPAMEPAIRIMFDCQSGGIAHYSRFRQAIEFDNAPRLFGLQMMEDRSYEGQNFPPFLVYGAAVDYLDNRWPEQWHLLERGIYEKCALRLVIHLLENNLRLLVVLPPENAPIEKYRLGLNGSPQRVGLFNALWRRFAQENPGTIYILEVADLVDSLDEMEDITHYHPTLLRKIADQMDLWVHRSIQGMGDAAAA